MLAAYQRANDLHSLLLPARRKWGSLEFNKAKFSNDEITQNEVTMSEINDRILLYLENSNLHRVIAGSNLDLIGGTGAVWVESKSDDEPIVFRSIPSVALYIEYSSDDLVSTAWYQCKMTNRAILEAFPKYRGKRRGELQENPNNISIVVYGQIPLQEHGQYYIYATLEEDNESLLWERNSSYPQIIIFRDRVRPGESEGRGVGIDMIPTIVDLNRMVRDDRKNIAFKANPPMFYDSDKFFNPYSVRQWAGALIARNPGGRNPLEALNMPVFPEVHQKILHLQEVIQKGFQVDPLGELQSPVRSATEIGYREARAQRTASTDISRLINEQPRQIYEVAAKILNERKLLTKNRDLRLSLSSNHFVFDFRSPLADVQAREDISNFVSNMQLKQQFYGAGSAVATTNIAEVNDWLTQAFSLNPRLFATKDQIQQYLQQLQQQQAQQPSPLPAATTQGAKVELPKYQGITI
jgi:hypothetical protein